MAMANLSHVGTRGYNYVNTQYRISLSSNITPDCLAVFVVKFVFPRV